MIYIWYWRASEARETLSGLFNRESLYMYIFLVCMSRLPFDLQRGHLNDSIARKEGFSVFLIFLLRKSGDEKSKLRFFLPTYSLLTTYSAHTSERVKAWKVTVVEIECDGAAF